MYHPVLPVQPVPQSMPVTTVALGTRVQPKNEKEERTKEMRLFLEYIPIPLSRQRAFNMIYTKHFETIVPVNGEQESFTGKTLKTTFAQLFGKFCTYLCDLSGNPRFTPEELKNCSLLFTFFVAPCHAPGKYYVELNAGRYLVKRAQIVFEMMVEMKMCLFNPSIMFDELGVGRLCNLYSNIKAFQVTFQYAGVKMDYELSETYSVQARMNTFVNALNTFRAGRLDLDDLYLITRDKTKEIRSSSSMEKFTQDFIEMIYLVVNHIHKMCSRPAVNHQMSLKLAVGFLRSCRMTTGRFFNIDSGRGLYEDAKADYFASNFMLLSGMTEDNGMTAVCLPTDDKSFNMLVDRNKRHEPGLAWVQKSALYQFCDSVQFYLESIHGFNTVEYCGFTPPPIVLESGMVDGRIFLDLVLNFSQVVPEVKQESLQAPQPTNSESWSADAYMIDAI